MLKPGRDCGLRGDGATSGIFSKTGSEGQNKRSIAGPPSVCSGTHRADVGAVVTRQRRAFVGLRPVIAIKAHNRFMTLLQIFVRSRYWAYVKSAPVIDISISSLIVLRAGNP